MSNEYDDIISAEPGPKANEYDSVLQVEGDQKRQALRSSILSTGDTNPDEAAKALQLSKRTGVPAPVVERNMPVVEKGAQLNEYDQLLNTAPVTAGALSDPAFARIAKDDAANMMNVEHTLKPPPAKPVVNAVEYSQMVQKAMKDNAIDADTARTLVSSHVQVNNTDPLLGQSRPGAGAATIGNTIEGLWKQLLSGGEQVRQGLRGQFADALGYQDMSADAIHKWASAELTQQVTTPKFDSYAAQLIYGGAANIMQNAPILAAAILTGNPEIAAALGALQQQTQSYGKYRERGATPGQAELGASIEGAIEYATERIPLKFLTEKFGKVPTWQLFVGEQAREQITEQIATHTQDLTDALIANPNMTIGQYLAARPDAALQTAVAVLMQGMVVATAHKAAIAMQGKTEASMRAQVDTDRMERLFKLAEASKVMERDPSSFSNFVQAAADQGQMGDIHVDARQFAQAAGEKLNDIVQVSPSVATQLETAMKSGGDLVIPTGEYTTQIAPLDSSGKLLEHLRVGPDAFSLNEAKTFMQDQAEQFNAEVQTVLEEKQFDTAFRESAANVETELLTQMNTANRFVSDTNAVMAKIAASYYTVQAAALGITPEQMYVKYPLRIGAESPLRGKMLMGQDNPFKNMKPPKNAVYDSVTKTKGIKNPRIIELAKKLDESFARSWAAFDKGDYETARQIDQDRRDTIGKEFDSLMAMRGETWRIDRGIASINSKTVSQSPKDANENTTQQNTTAQDDLDFTRSLAEPAELHTTVGGGHAEPGWAGATGIRRTNGQAATVYRGAGTRLAPEHFDVKSLGAASGNASSGLGVWFTNDRNEAVAYGEPESFNLDIRNPLTIRVEDLPGFDTVEEAHAWREQARAAGHDGLIITAAHLGGRTHIVAFDPHQVIYPQKTFNQETIDNESGALDEQPPFYSVLFRQLENSKMNTAPAAQWKAFINSLSNKGVKKEEVMMSGIMDWLDLRGTPREIASKAPPKWVALNADGSVNSGVLDEASGRRYIEQLNRPGMSVVDLSPADQKVDTPKNPDRVTKDEVLQYMRDNGTQVETKILGEPPKPVKKNQVAVAEPEPEEATGIPDGYDIEGTEEDANFEVNTPDGDTLGPFDTFSEAREEAYVHEALYDLPSEPYEESDDVQQRAERLWEQRDTDHYYEWARESDWVQYNDPHLVLPNARIVEVHAPADMFRGQDESGWVVQTLDYGDTDEIRDIADLPEPTPSDPVEIGGVSVFAHASDAVNALEAHGVGGDPWVSEEHGAYFIAEFKEHEDDMTDEHTTYRDAERDAERMQEEYVEQEVQSSIENDSFGDDGSEEYYVRQAMEELASEYEEERERAERRARREARGLPGTEHHREPVLDRNQVRHKNSWQSQGGSDYREIVLSVPGIDPYNAGDSTHFGTDTGGRTVAWARVKTHEDENGEFLWIEEIQSQRAQNGAESGFADPAGKAAAQAEFNRLQEEYAALQIRFMEAPSGEAAQIWEQQAAVQNRMNEVQNSIPTGTVPPAPFVMDTQSWTALMLKRVLHYAVEHGHTQVAWTTGAQQVRRYENALRKSVDEIKWEKGADGIHVVAMKDGQGVVDQKMHEGALRNMLGAGMAQDIINNPEQSGALSGLDIRVDDQGMNNYYGDVSGRNPQGKPAIMTIVMNKIVRGLGGQEVTMRHILPGITENHEAYNYAPVVTITPEMAAKIKGGFALFQENRGQITFGDTLNQASTITLLEHADLSTFFHELGHFMLEVQMDIASQPDAPQLIKDDVNKMLKWFGVPGIDVWRAMSLEEQRPYHEQFARGFEKYLFEGKAPSQELSSTFARIRAWFLNVYRALTNLNVNLTDEVRGVMDRLIASNEQIMAAEESRSYAPMYKSAEEMGATPEEWKAYQDLAYGATQSAVTELDKRSLRDMQWLKNAITGELGRLQKDAASKRNAVEAEVTAEVRSQPEYAVQRFLKYGELPEANRNREQRRIAEEASLQGTKLNLGDLKEMYGEGPAAPWRYLPTGTNGMVTAKDGMHPELVAQLFGFKSADEMIRKILAAQPEANVIEGMTDQRTLERYGDLTNETQMNRAAHEAVHNELRARVIATELRALDKATNPREDTGRTTTKGAKISLAVLPRAAKEFAHTIIARKKIRDVKPAQFEAAEARNARAAASKTDLVERATEKRNQLVNNYAAKEAYRALDEVEKGIEYFKRFDNKGTIKALSRDYLEQIYAILERYDLRKLPLNTAEKRQSLLEWVKSQEDQGFAPTIDKEILNEARRMPYVQMTVEEFRGMRDAIKNIEHLARLKQKLLTSKDQRDFRAQADSLAASIVDNAPKTIPPRRSSDHGLGVSVKSLFNTFTAIHRKFASFAREMDGWKDGGTAWELLVRNMNEKGTYEALENAKATQKIVPLLQPVLKQWGRRFTRRQDFNGKSYSPEERISLLLNMGNDTNMERVTTGENLSPAQLEHIVGHLTPADAKFVNDVWAFLDSYREQIGAKELRVNGVAPEWVEARPFQLKLATGQVIEMRGGYYPIAYDPLLNERAAAGTEADVYKQMSQGRYARAQTRRGHLESRVESTGRPLRFDFAQVLANHVSQVIHDLAWHEYMIDANRLMRDAAIENAMRNHYGVEVIKEMKDTLRDITIGPLNVDKGSQFLNYLRYGTTISGLALNVFNSLQNMTGITQSFARVGSGWMLKGIAHWAGDTITLQNSMKKVYAMSPMMAERARTGGNRELSELKGMVGGEFDNSKLMAVYWYLNNKTQQIVDIPTWWGAYEKAMAQENTDEGKAIALADQAVLDAQGGGQLKDLSGIQRGGAGLKLLTTFYGFFNTTFNLTAESYGRTDFKKPGDILIFGADMLLLYSIPALLSSLLKGWLQDDLDNPRRLTKRIISDQLNYMIGTMVGLREINAGLQAATGMSSMGYTGPAGLRIFNDLYNLGVQVHQARLDENFWKSLNSTMGILLHYPAGQLNRIGEALARYNDGKTSNPGILIAGPKPKK